MRLEHGLLEKDLQWAPAYSMGSLRYSGFPTYTLPVTLCSYCVMRSK